MGESDDPITFFHSGHRVERSALDPLAEKFEQNGYAVNYSSDTTETTKIGVYNTHEVTTGNINADHAVVLVNSVDDGYDPSFFWDERWNRFDLGLLIGDAVAEHWGSVSWNKYTRPSQGTYTVGWPKSDRVYTEEFNRKLKSKQEKLGLTDGTTAIYAPAEESDGKMFDFLEAADGAVDNVVIKHKGNEDYSEVHRENFESNLTILDTEVDVFVAFGLGDMLISEKSGVFLDAIHVDTIPISVTDWPVNFRSGQQYPGDDLPDFVERTTRQDLRSTIEDVRDGDITRDFDAIRNRHFENLGKSSASAMDVIETVLINGETHPSRVEPKFDAGSTSWIERQYINGKMLAKSKLSAEQKYRLMDFGVGRLLTRLDDLLLRNRKD